MSIPCMISLLISVGAVYFSIQTAEEIVAVMATLIAALSFILSLVLASWPIQLLAAIALITVSRFYLSDESHLS